MIEEYSNNMTIRLEQVQGKLVFQDRDFALCIKKFFDFENKVAYMVMKSFENLVP